MIPQMRGEEIISENFDKIFSTDQSKKSQPIFLLQINKSTPYFIKTPSKQNYSCLQRMGDFLEKNIYQKREIQMELMLFQMEAIFILISQKSWTTTNLTPDEINKIGLKEVAMLRAEMESKNSIRF